MPRDNRLAARLNEHLHYARGLSLTDLLDVFSYSSKGRYFHTVDGRFARIWKLATYSSDVLTPNERLYLTDGLARVINEYPDGTSGQVLRMTHRDVSPMLARYLEDSQATGFGRDLIEAVAQRQLDGARYGFFADVTADQVAEARQELLKTGLPDVDSADEMFENIERSMTTGRYALVTDLYLVFMYIPSWMKIGSMGVSFAKKLMGEMGMLDLGREYQRAYEREKHEFLGYCTRIETRAANGGFVPASMNGQALLNLLYRELNPTRSLTVPPPKYVSHYTIREQLDIVRDEKIPDLAKQTTYSTLKTSREGWEIDGMHYRAVSAKTLPQRITPGKLSDALATVEGENWCTLNFAVPNQPVIRKALVLRGASLDNSTAAQWMKHPLFRGDERMRQEKQGDVEAVQHSMNIEKLDREKVVDVSVHVVLKNADEHEAMESARKVTDLLWNAGFLETNRGDAMIHQCLPLNYRPAAREFIARDVRCLSTNVADLAPLFTAYSGIDKPGMLVNNEHGEPIFIDIFATRAAHSLIQGSTGSGKSFLFNNILMQLQKYDPKIFIIDKGGSYKSQCQALGGAYIDLSFDNVDGKPPVCINPFYTRPNTQLGMEELEFMRNIVVAMIEAGARDERVDKKHVNMIMDAIKTVFDERQKKDPAREVVLSDIYNCLMKRTDLFGEVGKDIALRFKEFTAGYPYGAVFDGKLGISWENNFIVLETQRMSSSAALPVAMLALFQQINIYCKFVLPQSRYKVVAVDEAWSALSSPTAATTIAGFFREMRKYRCGVLLISQTIKDFANIVSNDNSSGGGILENTRHFFLMPSSNSDHEEARGLLKLGDPQIDSWSGLASLPPFFSECFYHYIDDTDRPIDGKFRLYSNGLSLWTATTDPVDKEMRDTLFTEYARTMNPAAARARALHELANKYRFGFKYQQNKQRAA